jgi:hypothetical protein
VVLSKNTIIANGLDRVTVTVTVAVANGLPLEGLTVAIADCEHCDRIIILPFTDRVEGIYDSALVRWDLIQGGGVDMLYFSVTDGINTIQLGPVELSVVAPPRPNGGCTVGDSESADSTMLLLLLLSVLSIWRRRYRPPMVF